MDASTERKYLSLLDQAAQKIESLIAENRKLSTREPIAVVGMGCRFAGGVDSPAALWELLSSRRDVVGPAPAARFDLARHHSPERAAPGKTYVREGAFLDRVDGFDAAFFGIAPLEAEALDPQQRLLLEVCWEALEHAGISPDRLRGSRTGVYVGMNNVDYFQAHIHSGHLDRIGAHAATGVMLSTAAGRLAYTFDFRGPVLTLDTACSASLLSVHLAIRALRHGEADLAVAGGVNLILSAAGFVAMAKTEGLSPDGRCRPFDARASGYGRGEGCGLVVLKRLSDALESGDRVLALLEGSATNHDGRSNGLTAPNGPAQAAVIRAALRDAHASVSSIGYVEAHGSATVLGDPIEAHALGQVFAPSARGEPLPIGSVKGHLGHTEAAAGVLGLIKAVLAVRAAAIPPTLHLEAPNPHIPVAELGLELVREMRDWPAPSSGPRRAGVSSFGLSGSNVHVVVASAEERSETARGATSTQLLVLSAKTPAALESRARALSSWLDAHDADFADVCHTASRRAQFEQRLAVIAEGAPAAAAALRQAAAGGASAEVFQGSARAGEPRRVLLSCSEGRGWLAHAGLGPSSSPWRHRACREALERCDTAARPWLGLSLSSWIETGDDAGSPATARALLPPLAELALQYAAAELLRACGVRPAAVLCDGSSWLGACLAGALSIEEAIAGRADETEAAARHGVAALTSSRPLEVPLYCTRTGRRWLELARSDGRSSPPGEPERERARAIEAARADGHALWIDLGNPEPTRELAGAGVSVLRLAPPSDGARCRRAFLEVLAQLYVSGHDLDWGAWSEQRAAGLVDLPTYPFERRSFWMPVIAEAERPGAQAEPVRRVELGAEHTMTPRHRDTATSELAAGELPARGAAQRAASSSPPPTALQDQLARRQLESLERVLCGNLEAARQLVEHQLRWLGGEARPATPAIPEARAPGDVRPASRAPAQDAAPAPQATEIEPTSAEGRDTLPSPAAPPSPPRRSRSVDTALPPFSVAFEAVAREHGARIAVEAGAHAVSYAELNRRANQLAHALVALGAGPGVAVAVALPQGIDYATTLLAVAKARAVLLPIDTSLPRRRCLGLFERAEPRLLVTHDDGTRWLTELELPAKLLPAEVLLLSLGAISRLSASALRAPTPRPGTHAIALGDLPHTDLPSAPEPDDTAYMMFTSGSTGQPKALLGTHAGLSHFMSWELAELGPGASARVSGLIATTFDASLRDLLLPLLGGGTLCVPDPEIRQDPRRLLEWLRASGIVTLHTVPSLFRLLLDAAEDAAPPGSGAALPALRFALLAGEPLRVRDAQRSAALLGDHSCLINLYGASETTMVKLFHRVDRDELTRAEPAAILPIGVPMPGVEIYLLKDDRLAGPGEIGEICVRTPFRCPGYHGDPERTAQVFQPHPLAGGAVLYRSGDLGRRRPSGVYEFVGRLDRQVKIGGVRVELAEIDQALLSCPEVREAHARAVAGADGELVLVAYYSAGAPLEEQRLRQHLEERLPSALLPARLIRLDALPLNLHGKVDPRALPDPDWTQTVPDAACAPPQTATERALLAIWQSVLGAQGFGVESRFLDVGGNSLRALRVLARVTRELGASVRIRDFFEDATIRQLGRRIDERRALSAPAIARAPEQPDYPLSAAQRRLWLHQRLHAAASQYNLASAFRIDGPLDAPALLRAIEALVARHESLRTTFPVVNGEPRQRIHPAAPNAVELVELDAHPDAWARALAGAAHLLSAPYDLGRGPLFRATLWRVAPECHVLGIGFHHVVGDGASQSVLARDLGVAYARAARGERPRLPDVSLRYRDFACHERAQRSSERDAAAREFWGRALAGVPQLELPADRPAPALPSGRGDSVVAELPRELRRELERLARERSTSLFTLLLCLVKVLVHRYTGQTDLLVATPWAGREAPELEDSVGFYVNLLPLRGSLHTDEPFTRALDRARETVTTALEHAAFPFDAMLDALPAADRARAANLVQVLVALQDFDDQTLALEGSRVTELELDQKAARFPMAWEFVTTPDGGLRLRIEYDTDRFDRDRIERAVAHFQTLAHAAIEEPERAIGRLRLLPPAERARVLQDFNAPGRHLRAGLTLVDLFDEHAQRTPDAPAVMDGNGHLSHADLARRSTRLALSLFERGVQPGEVIGVLLPRGSDVLLAFLAVLRAGAVYLPLDPSYPAERLSLSIEDSGCRHVITRSSLLESRLSLPALAGTPVALEGALVTLDLRAASGSGDTSRIESGAAAAPAPDAPAYLIYTSGSTGTPKGVICRHDGLTNLAQAQIAAFDVRPGDRVLSLAALGFDASIAEFAQALGSGAALVFGPDPASLRPRQMLELLRRESITLATFTPSLLAELEPEPLPALRTLVVAGEACPAELVRRWAGHADFFNAYGPTEATVCATLGRCDPTEAIPNIGRAIEGAQVYVLDAQLEPVPIGIAGELCIGGIGVARGYLQRAETSAEKFVSDPFRDAPGALLYRSGDLARYRADGCLEFLGRIDRQIKLRGFRVEPAEVERALGAIPGVLACAVAARDGVASAQQWLGYVVTAEPPPTDAELRAGARQRLPQHLVPSHFVRLERLPLTVHGKIDYAALPAPEAPRSGSVAAPGDPLERWLLEQFRELLGAAHVGMDDDFFAAGGHSLLAIQLFDRIEREHDIALPISTLVTASSAAQLSLVLRESGAGCASGQLLTRLGAGRAGDLPASTPLICIHPSGGDVLCFSTLARQLGHHRPVHAMAAVGLQTDAAPLGEVQDMARHYLLELERAGLGGSVPLLGYSFGGLVAYEMTRQRRRAGLPPGPLILVDTPCPRRPRAGGTDTGEAELEILLATVGGRLTVTSEELRPLDSDARIALLCERARDAQREGNALSPERLARSLRVHLSCFRALSRYTVRDSAASARDDEPVLLARASRFTPDGERFPEEDLGWSRVLGRAVDVEWIAGDHTSMLHAPGASELAEQIERRLTAWEAASASAPSRARTA